MSARRVTVAIAEGNVSSLEAPRRRWLVLSHLGGYRLREEREAVSLTPWLQPGGQGLQNDSLNRFQRFLQCSSHQKPLETVPVNAGLLSRA